MHKLFKIRKLMDKRGGMLKNYNKKEIKGLKKINFTMKENLFSIYKKKNVVRGLYMQQGKFAESEEATEREQKFARERSRQATLLANAKAERSRLEAIATQLEARFEANDGKLVVFTCWE